jgi:hypothetical protein
VLQAALQAAWAEILVETASSFHGLDSPSKAALSGKRRTMYNNAPKGAMHWQMEQTHESMVLVVTAFKMY